MEGIKGLELLSTSTSSVGGTDIGIIIVGIFFILLGVLVFYLAIQDKNDFGATITVLATFAIGGCLIASGISGRPVQDINTYKLSIVAEDYHVELRKYEVVSIEDKLIIIRDIKK